jgi:hypothetical protein
MWLTRWAYEECQHTIRNKPERSDVPHDTLQPVEILRSMHKAPKGYTGYVVVCGSSD